MKLGSRVGPYEIVSPVGAGGMGEVFRARDARLGRDVAVKVLPEELAKDPDRLRRFEKEARAAGLLQHPNLLTVFDTGVHEGTPYVVFELLEGQTLRQALGPGPLAPLRAVELGRQIAQGLAAAHEKGLVHRDLKPENLFLTRDGGLKILDFGLAKLDSRAGLGADEASTTSGTEDGTVLGTTGYMSPEQVRGQPADARSDIFSFGSVLYEMLSGRRAFEGATAADRMTAILKEDPPLLGMRGSVGPGAEKLVQRCLEKQATRRFQSAHDLRLALEVVAAGGEPASHARTARGAGDAWPRARRAVALTLAFAAAAAAGLWAGRHTRPRDVAPPVPVHFAFTVERSGVFSSENATPGIVTPGRSGGLLALCPDGSCVVYRGSRDGVGVLFHRPFDSLSSAPLPGTERGYAPFFSPDGRTLAFFADDRLKKIEIARPIVQVVCSAPLAGSGFWGGDGTILFAAAQGGPVFSVPAAGGEPRAVTRLDAGAGEITHRWPSLLPDGHTLVYEVVNKTAHSRVVVDSPATGRRETLLDGGQEPRVTADGHLLYMRGNTLRAAPLDLRTARLAGDSVDSIVSTIGSRLAVGRVDVAANGTLAWLTIQETDKSRHRLWRVERSGRAAPLSDLRHAFSFPRVSPDGRKLAVTILEPGGSYVSVYDLERRSLTRLTREGDSAAAIWTRDGKRLVYRSNRGGEWNLYAEPADGSGPVERLTSGPLDQYPVSWSPDGRTLSFEESDLATGPDIRTLSFEQTPVIRSFVNGPYGEWDGQFSPDGLVAYTSIESGRLEVYLRPYPGPGGRQQVSTEGGNSPVWSRSGRELFYLNGERMMAVAVRGGAEPVVGRPVELFAGQYDYVGQVANFDVTPDDRGFVMVRGDEGANPWMQLNVTVNWFEELRRRERR
jgi:Tol biopolymer transport system component